MIAGPDASASAENPSARSGGPDEQLNIEKALQIVSDHYGKRNATFSLLSEINVKRGSSGLVIEVPI